MEGSVKKKKLELGKAEYTKLLLAMVFVHRKMQGKPRVRLSRKVIGASMLAGAGCLIFGLGMCMTMVWEGMLVWGVIVGLIGIILLLCLIPFCIGLK